MNGPLTLGNWIMITLLVAAIAVTGWFLIGAVAMIALEVIYQVTRRTHRG